MINRNKGKLSKLIIGFVLFTGIIGGSAIIAFAHEDISSLLSDWFHEKTDSMMGEVSEEIEAEKESQTIRLEEELTAMIEEAEQNLMEFTTEEKAKRVDQIQTYADQLLDGFEVDREDEKEELESGFDEILKEAKKAMEQLANEHATENNIDDE